MGANEPIRCQRMFGAVGISVALLAAANLGCGGASGNASAGEMAAEGGAATVENGSGGLLELQTGLPAGHSGAWYTERLAALDYRVTSLRNEADGVATYRVTKAAESFDVRVAIDAGAGAARSVEILPLAGPQSDAGVDNGAVASGAPAAAAPAGPRQGDERGMVRDEAGGGSERQPEPPASSKPVTPATDRVVEAANGDVETREESIDTRLPEPAVEPRAGEPASGPRPAAPVIASSPAPPPPPRRRIVTVPAGSRIAARLDGSLSSANATVGDEFSLSVREALWVDGLEVLPAGAQVFGHVAEVERAGRPNKGGRLVLAADGVWLDGEELPMDALVTLDGASLEGRDSAHEDAKEVAVGAGLGGLVGGLLGGKKGVLIGVLAGGGGTFVATKGEEVELTDATPLFVELRRDLAVAFVYAE